MKLGIFDSGLGGLLISKSIRDYMPDIDLVYCGDTLHLPYGNRSEDAIYLYTKRCLDALFKQGCSLIVMACNTASAACLRRVQQEYLPQHWPGRNVIGVVVPTLEYALDQKAKNIGLIATNYIVKSNVYEEELQKINQDVRLQSLATPLLVPLIENGGEAWLKSVVEHYLNAFDLDKMQSMILGCTHYVRLKKLVSDLLPSHIGVISQDEIIPRSLSLYLDRHPEYEIGRTGASEFYVTDITDHYMRAATDLYGSQINIQKIEV